MSRVSIRTSPMTAPAASSSAKDGIFPTAGPWAAAGPRDQAITAQQPPSKRARTAARTRVTPV